MGWPEAAPSEDFARARARRQRVRAGTLVFMRPTSKTATNASWVDSSIPETAW